VRDRSLESVGRSGRAENEKQPGKEQNKFPILHFDCVCNSVSGPEFLNRIKQQQQQQQQKKKKNHPIATSATGLVKPRERLPCVSHQGANIRQTVVFTLKETQVHISSSDSRLFKQAGRVVH
jgi:hypothetical protein